MLTSLMNIQNQQFLKQLFIVVSFIQVWSALDKHEYLKASQLYLLSQHIVDNTLHINTGHSAKYAATRDIYVCFHLFIHLDLNEF